MEIANISVGGISLRAAEIGEWTEHSTPAAVVLDCQGTEVTFPVRLQFRYFHAASGSAGFEFENLTPGQVAMLSVALQGQTDGCDGLADESWSSRVQTAFDEHYAGHGCGSC